MELEFYDEDNTAFLPVALVDVEDGEPIVRFASGDEDLVDWDCLFLPPKADAAFTPKVGDGVQVLSLIGAEVGQGWFDATVTKSTGGEFLFVHYSQYDETFDEIVVVDRVRKLCQPTPLQSTGIKKVEVKLPPRITDVSRDPSVHNDLRDKAGLISVDLNAEGTALRLLGTADSLDKALLLSDMHFKRLDDLKTHGDSMKNIATKLEQRKKYEKESEVVEFTVPEQYMGLAIGKGGSNINQVKDLDGIHSVEVVPDTSTFRIMGRTPDVIESAKSMLDFCEMEYSVSQTIVGQVIGQKGKNIQEIIDKSGVVKMQLVEQKNKPADVTFIFVGRRTNCENALLLLEYHESTISARQQMDVERSDIETQLQSLGLRGRDGGRGSDRGGRGAGRGSDRGGRGAGRGSGRGRSSNRIVGQEGPPPRSQDRSNKEDVRDRDAVQNGVRRPQAIRSGFVTERAGSRTVKVGATSSDTRLPRAKPHEAVETTQSMQRGKSTGTQGSIASQERSRDADDHIRQAGRGRGSARRGGGRTGSDRNIPLSSDQILREPKAGRPGRKLVPRKDSESTGNNSREPLIDGEPAKETHVTATSNSSKMDDNKKSKRGKGRPRVITKNTVDTIKTQVSETDTKSSEPKSSEGSAPRGQRIARPQRKRAEESPKE